MPLSAAKDRERKEKAREHTLAMREMEASHRAELKQVRQLISSFISC